MLVKSAGIARPFVCIQPHLDRFRFLLSPFSISDTIFQLHFAGISVNEFSGSFYVFIYETIYEWENYKSKALH